MKNIIACIAVLLVCSHPPVQCQDLKGIRAGMTSEQTLRAILNPSLYSATTGFDGRYEGIKGSSRLIDSLVPSTVKLKGYKEIFEVATDIDVVRNTMIFRLSSSDDLLQVSSSHISELIMHLPDGDKLFRGSEGMPFDREITGNKFIQVLKEKPWMFVRIPDRRFREAHFTGLYNPDIRYDEYIPADRYYIMGNDGILHRIQLNRKSLLKLFPDKSKLINSSFKERKGTEIREDEIITLLEKF